MNNQIKLRSNLELLEFIESEVPGSHRFEVINIVEKGGFPCELHNLVG